MEGIIKDTMANVHRPVHMRGIDGLIVKTTGMASGSPTIEGVIADTKHAIHDKKVPELHKVHHVGKTQARSFGQVPYAGKMY